MNIPALEKVRSHLGVASVCPTNIQFNMSLNAQPPSEDATTATFSRFQWTLLGHGQSVSGLVTAAGQAEMLVFLVATKAEIAFTPASGPIPESDPIPAELTLATIEIKFASTYVSDIPISNLDPEGLQEFAQYNAPYHFWPYWRELLQNLALRAQLPVPYLPPYHVPSEARPATTAEK